METRTSRFAPHAILIIATLLAPSSWAQTNWNVNANGNWSESTNWSPTTINGPSGTGAVVNFTNNIAGGSTGRTVSLDLNRTVGILNIGDSNGSSPFTINTTNSSVLTLDNGASAAQINFVAAGSGNTISAPLALAGNLDVTNSTALEQRIDGSIDTLTTTARTITFTAASTGMLHIRGLANATTGPINFINNASSGTLQFSNLDRVFTGTITNNAGTLAIGTGGGNPLGLTTLVLNGGTISTAGSSSRSVSNDYVIGGDIGVVNTTVDKVFNLSGNGILGSGTYTITVTSAGGDTTIQNGNLTGSGGIIKAGSGTLGFATAGSKQYTGGTIVNEGTLLFRAGNSNVFSDPSTADITVNNGANVDVLANQSLGLVTINSGTMSFSTGSFTTVTAESYVVQSGSIGVRMAGSDADTSLTKNGAGTMTLSQINTYTGDTIINEGTLILSAEGGSVASTTLGFGVTDAASGVLQVENSAFSFNGTIELTLSSVTSFNDSWDLFTGTAFTAGDLSLANLTSDIVGLTFVEDGGIWSGMEGERTWSFDESTGVLSVVPEPTTYGLLILGLSACLFFRRRIQAA